MARLDEQLEKAFGGYSNKKTNALYQRWVCRLIRFHGKKIRPEKMEQWHIDEFLAHIARDCNYARSTTNQAKQSLKIFFKAIDHQVGIKQVSTRNYLHIPDILSRSQIKNLLDNLTPPYLQIASGIYDLISPQVALKQYYSRGSTVHINTLNAKLKQAAKTSAIHVTAKTLRQTGIVHRLQDTNDPALVAEMAGLKKSTMARYIKLARQTSRLSP